jgi:hypothetical protein
MSAAACAAHTVCLTVDTFGTHTAGPGRPFATPWLAVCDTIRLVCVVCFGVGAAGVLLRWRRVERAARTLMVAGLAYSWSAVETEWDKLGYGIGVGGRLWINLAASLLFAGWVWLRIAEAARREVRCG